MGTKEMLKLSLGVLIVCTLPAVGVSAKQKVHSPVRCVALIEDMRAMEKAQSEIMKSLVNNHETMATSLESYSSEVQTHQEHLNRAVLAKELKNSAQAFRDRGVKAKKISNAFENASRNLLKKVNQCLAKNN